MVSRLNAAGYLTLGARTARALVRMLMDGLEEGLGRALPRTPQQLARPAIVNELLRGSAPSDASHLPPVRQEPVHS